jgi:ABC-2 type transport system permease protein
MTPRLLRIFSYELRRNFRRKGYLFGTFGVPIIGFILAIGFQVLGGAPQTTQIGPAMMNMPVGLDGIQHAGYVDQAGIIAETGELAGVFTAYPHETAARGALDAGEIEVYYLIPADYLETGEVTQVMSELSFNFINQDGIRRLLLNALAEDVDSPQVFERLVNPAAFEEVLLQRAAPQGMEQDEISTIFIVYIFAILLLMSLFMTSSYLMQSVIEEKESRLIEILIASVRPLELLGGKILALGLLGLFQMVTWLAGLVLIAKVGGADIIAGGALQLFKNFYVPPELVALTLVYFVLAYLMFASAYAAIGALSNSMREGPQYAAIFTLPAVIPMWFLQLVVAEPNGTFAVFLSLFPITAPLGMIERMAATDVPVWHIALSLLLLILGVIASMWFAGRLFRVQTLLAGQTPRLRDLPRLVRG